MSKLFSNGCSFLTPRPKDGVNTFVTQILAEQYNLQLFNLAMGGRGNDRISFTTKLWFEQNGTDNIFAVIGWSSTFRNDYVTHDGWKKGRIPGMDLTWRTWKVADQLRFVNSNVGWDIDNTGIMRYIDHVFDLQNYFILKKIPYVMYNALPNVFIKEFPNTLPNAFNMKIKDFAHMYKAVDLKRFFKPETNHYDFVTKENMIVSPKDPHPSVEGHTQWTKQLKEFIDANNLRTI